MEYFSLGNMDWHYLYDVAEENALVLGVCVFLFLLGYLIDGLRGAAITIFVGLGSYLLYLNDLLPF